MKKKIIKTCAVFMACLTLSLSMFQAYTVPVQASALSVTTEWIIDKVLAKCGIVANASSLSEIKNVLFTDLDSCFANYISWCDANGKDWKDGASYDEWFATNGGNAILNKLVEVRRNSAETDAKTRKFSDDEVIDVLLPDHGGGGKERTISKDIGQPIVDAFKTWWKDCGGYYLYCVPSYKEIASLFYNVSQYENAKWLCENNDLLYLRLFYDTTQNNNNVSISYDVLDSFDGFVNAYSSDDILYFQNCSDWVVTGRMNDLYSFYDSSGTKLDWNTNLPYARVFDEYTVVEQRTSTYSGDMTHKLGNYTYSSGSTCLFTFVANESFNIKLWKSLSAFKSYSIGAQNVYYSPTYTTVVNNDVTISNDYITTYANQYSYSIVQNEIDNSTDITEETINNIVDNSVTNITNNYYYTSSAPDSDGTTSGGDSDSDDSLNGGDYDGLFDGLLGNLLSLITNLLEFVVNLLVKGVELIVGGVTSIISLINMAMEQIGDLGGILSAFMPFVPEEYFVLIMGTISVLCGLAIYKFLKG